MSDSTYRQHQVDCGLEPIVAAAALLDVVADALLSDLRNGRYARARLIAGCPGRHATTSIIIDDGIVRTDPEEMRQVLSTVVDGLTSAGALILRTRVPGSDGDHTRARGWALRGGRWVGTAEAELFDAFCTDPDTGDPIPPEPGLNYVATA